MTRKTASDFFDEDKEKVKADSVTEESVKECVTESIEDEKETLPIAAKSEKDTTADSQSKIPSPTLPSVSQSQEEYMKQYQQYMQQYQQYYAQYYNQSYTNAPSDPAYEYFTGSSAATTAPPAASFDVSRASRQMAAYFDPTKFQAALSPEMLAAQRAQKQLLQAKLTAKEIEAFKKKKIEKKKAKNRWFYE